MEYFKKVAGNRHFPKWLCLFPSPDTSSARNEGKFTCPCVSSRKDTIHVGDEKSLSHRFFQAISCRDIFLFHAEYQCCDPGLHILLDPRVKAIPCTFHPRLFCCFFIIQRLTKHAVPDQIFFCDSVALIIHCPQTLPPAPSWHFPQPKPRCGNLHVLLSAKRAFVFLKISCKKCAQVSIQQFCCNLAAKDERIPAGR